MGIRFKKVISISLVYALTSCGSLGYDSMIYTVDSRQKDNLVWLGGTVMDDRGVTIPQSKIYIVGSIKSQPHYRDTTQTNDDGEYFLKIPVGKYTLEASYIGQKTEKTRKIGVKDKDSLIVNFVLREKEEFMENVMDY